MENDPLPEKTLPPWEQESIADGPITRRAGESGLRADSSDSVGPIVWTTAICATISVLGHGVLWLAYSLEWNRDGNVNVPWQPVAGISMSVVAIVAFGGFYLASRRARIAIASSFLLTFLVSLTFILTINALAGATQGDAKEIFDDFRTIVLTVIASYFGSETIVSVSKIIGVSRAGNSDSIKTADRDLVSPVES